MEVFEKKSDGNFIQIWDFSLTMPCHALDSGAQFLQYEREKLSHMLSTKACFGIFIGFPASTFVKISNSFCSSITLAGGAILHHRP